MGSTMWEQLRDFWVPRILFTLTMGLAVVLVGMVLLAPSLGNKTDTEIVNLFASDAIVRRTSLASAVGLVVTAYVFFRPGGYLFFRSHRDKNRLPPPMAGA
jgi:hypothetical protein